LYDLFRVWGGIWRVLRRGLRL